MSASLAQTNWIPLVLSVEPKDFGVNSDPALAHLIPPDLAIERVRALPAKWCRYFGLGDVSLRAYFSLRTKLEQIITRGDVDLVFATVLPGYSSLLGAWAKRRFGVRFILDYQDPWVSKWGETQPWWTKSGVSHRLAKHLESRVLPHVDAVTAVSASTLDTLRARNLLKSDLPVGIIPIGADTMDHDVARRFGRSRIQKKPGVFDIAYLGTVTERMLPALKAFFAGVALCSKRTRRRFTVHLIGTSGQQNGADTHEILKLAREHGLANSVTLDPARIGYLDALKTMQDSDLLVLLGSTDRHYTASKLFPYWLSEKPIFGLFHEASTVIDMSRKLGGVKLVAYNDSVSPDLRISDVAEAIEHIILDVCNAIQDRNPSAFGAYSAEGVARQFASLFDTVL